MTARDLAYVVQSPSGRPLAVFKDREAAQAYADAREGRLLFPVPCIAQHVPVTTVHTRWVQVEADGTVVSHAHDTYGWCAELDAEEGQPPLAEVEQYQDGRSIRLLGVGIDLAQLDEALRDAVLLHTRLTPSPASP